MVQPVFNHAGQEQVRDFFHGGMTTKRLDRVIEEERNVCILVERRTYMNVRVCIIMHTTCTHQSCDLKIKISLEVVCPTVLCTCAHTCTFSALACMYLRYVPSVCIYESTHVLDLDLLVTSPMTSRYYIKFSNFHTSHFYFILHTNTSSPQDFW